MSGGCVGVSSEHLPLEILPASPYLRGLWGVTWSRIEHEHPVGDDREILKRVHDFEPRALAEVYDHYSTDLFRYAVRLLGNPDLAEDCVAETFSRFLRAVRDGSGPHQYLRAYLYRVAHNWIADRYRRQPPPPLSLEESQEVAGGEDPAEAAQRQLESEELRAALLLLTADQRQVVVLKFLEGWRNEEIAQALNRSVGSVKALQHRALAALRRILIGEEAGR